MRSRLSVLAFQTAIVSICEWRYFKKNGKARGSEKETEFENV